ncbi:MAG: TonB-dependent receptor, partial [Acidobacteriota bacterium]|nr:TonB-dependent receptor [Acidobacteriota bacterium]
MVNRWLTSGRLCAGLVALFLFGSVLFGQTAQITGRVTDQAGAVVPNALITATNSDTGIVRKAPSSQDGYFTVPLLQPGPYQISLEMTGFKSIVRTGVQLAVDQVLRIDFALELGSVSEKVQVVAQAESLESETATLAQLIQGKQILDLPLLGRNPYALAGLAPGVRTSIGMNDIAVDMISTGSVSINGQRGNQNEYLLDGAPNTGASQNQPIIFANVDSVQEFRVETNAFRAEYGRAAGGIFNVITKSGTNQLHFSAYEFLRNDKLNANDWFANRGGVNRPPFRFNQFGGTLGLPVVIPHLYNGRNKTFLFLATELVRFAQGVTFTGTVPDAALLSGDFSNLKNAAGQKITIYDPRSTAPNPSGSGFIRTPFLNNLIPKDRISPIAAAIAKFWPAPNTTGAAFTAVGNYVNTGANIINKNTYSVRLDHNFSEQDHFFTRYSYDDTPKISAGPYGQTNPASPAGGTQDFTRMNAVMEETHIFSPSLIGEFRASFSRFSNFRNPFSDGFDMTSLGLSPRLVAQLAGLRAFPAISVTGYTVTASVPNTVQGGPSLGADGMIAIGMNNYALQVATTKTFAKHTMKLGGEYRIVRFNALQTNDSATQFSFASSFTQGPNPTATTAIAGNALATFLLGIPGGVTAPSPALAQQTLYAAGYLQDDWKITSNLTVNLGLRYEVELPRTDRFNQLTNFDPSGVPPLKAAGLDLHGVLTFAGVNGLSRFQAEPDLNNFAPRLGIAWRATPKTVVRTGGGVFYSSLTGIGSAPNVFGTTGFLSTTNITTSLDGITPVVNLNNPFPDGVNQPTGSSLGPATFLGQTANSYDRSNRVPLSFQWNLDVQRELPRSVLLDLG